MTSVRIGKNITGYCDWCAKPVSRTLVPVTLVTPRGVFHETICDECAEELQERPQADSARTP